MTKEEFETAEFHKNMVIQFPNNKYNFTGLISAVNFSTGMIWAKNRAYEVKKCKGHYSEIKILM